MRLPLSLSNAEVNIHAQPVFKAGEMAAVDRYTIEELGIPGMVLMEQAGRAVAEKCCELLRRIERPRIVVVCGRGNNGGDGYVVARRLRQTFDHCIVVTLAEPEQLGGDALQNFEIWQKLEGTTMPLDRRGMQAIREADLLVDAMLGTGARGELRGDFKKAAVAINQSRAKVVAVDLPTGADANTGQADPDTVRAGATVTFGALKRGLLFWPARGCAGEITVADIGFPRQAFARETGQVFLLDAPAAAGLLPRRPPTAFKNQCGQVYLVAGSLGMGGAAYMAAQATIQSGAGLVILGCPRTLAVQMEGRLITVIKEPLAEGDGALHPDAWPQIERRLEWADALAIGPGLGTAPQVQDIVLRVVESYRGVLVIDADGLNALSGHVELLRKRPGPTILTPHPGEFRRLTGVGKEELARQPIEAAQEFAANSGAHVLLKGAPSLTALPGGEVFVNHAGNPGMASAGMGDVLTGVIAGIAGQGKDAAQAALLGMFVHSFAGDLAAASVGELSLTATDVLAAVPQAFEKLQRVQAGQADAA